LTEEQKINFWPKLIFRPKLILNFLNHSSKI
jgi:hypothetical protein